MKNRISINIIVLFIILNTLTINPFSDFILSSEGDSKQERVLNNLSKEKNIDNQEKIDGLFTKINSIKDYIPNRIVSSEKWFGMI